MSVLEMIEDYRVHQSKFFAEKFTLLTDDEIIDGLKECEESKSKSYVYKFITHINNHTVGLKISREKTDDGSYSYSVERCDRKVTSTSEDRALDTLHFLNRAETPRVADWMKALSLIKISQSDSFEYAMNAFACENGIDRLRLLLKKANDLVIENYPVSDPIPDYVIPEKPNEKLILPRESKQDKKAYVVKW